MNEQAWWQRAACAGTPYPWDLDRSTPTQWAWAIGVCRTCPVRVECAADARHEVQDHVIRAGVPYLRNQPLNARGLQAFAATQHQRDHAA